MMSCHLGENSRGKVAEDAADMIGVCHNFILNQLMPVHVTTRRVRKLTPRMSKISSITRRSVNTFLRHATYSAPLSQSIPPF